MVGQGSPLVKWRVATPVSSSRVFVAGLPGCVEVEKKIVPQTCMLLVGLPCNPVTP